MFTKFSTIIMPLRCSYTSEGPCCRVTYTAVEVRSYSIAYLYISLYMLTAVCWSSRWLNICLAI